MASLVVHRAPVRAALRPSGGPGAVVLAATLPTPAIEAAPVWLFKTLVDGVLVPPGPVIVSLPERS